MCYHADPGSDVAIGRLQVSGDGSDHTFQGVSADGAATDSREDSPPPQVLLLPETNASVKQLRK